MVASVVLLAACSGSDDTSAASSGDRGDDASTTEATGDADGGTIHETVPTVAKPVLDAVAIGALGEFGDGVTARLAAVDDVEIEAFMPGEVSGPGVAITVELTNGSPAVIDLDNVTVDLVATGDRYATLITTRDETRLAGDLAPGATSQGSYQFTIAVEDRSDVAVRVTYAAPKPTVVFEGSLIDA